VLDYIHGRQHTFHFIVVGPLMVGELQNLDDLGVSRFVSRDKPMLGQPVKHRIYVRIVAIRKDLGLESQRAILKTPITVGFAPEAFEQDRQQRISGT
jgi:hypothetical protein